MVLHLVMWLREGSGIEPRLSELLRRLDMAVEDERDFICARFTYGESLKRIAPVAQNLVDRLASSGDIPG